MKFLMINNLNTSTTAQILADLCLPKLKKGGYAVMYLPPGKDGFEFIPINFENLKITLVSMLREKGYDKRLLLAKDRNSYDKLLSKLGRKVCGITMLEEFVDYVIASKRKKWKDMIRSQEELECRLAEYHSIQGECILLWAEYDIGFNLGAKNQRPPIRWRPYLQNKIKNYGEIIR